MKYAMIHLISMWGIWNCSQHALHILHPLKAICLYSKLLVITFKFDLSQLNAFFASRNLARMGWNNSSLFFYVWTFFKFPEKNHEEQDIQMISFPLLCWYTSKIKWENPKVFVSWLGKNVFYGDSFLREMVVIFRGKNWKNVYSK